MAIDTIFFLWLNWNFVSFRVLMISKRVAQIGLQLQTVWAASLRKPGIVNTKIMLLYDHV